MIDEDGRLEDIYDALVHVSSIFPSDTNLTCTLTAKDTANTFSDWAEIEDNTGGTTLKLSAQFATLPGHITAVMVETVSQDDTIYEFEIAWGAAKNVVGRFRFAGGTKFQAPNTTARYWAPNIPAGETVYYRMKSATAVADTCTVHFRFHTH